MREALFLMDGGAKATLQQEKGQLGVNEEEDIKTSPSLFILPPTALINMTIWCTHFES